MWLLADVGKIGRERVKTMPKSTSKKKGRTSTSKPRKRSGARRTPSPLGQLSKEIEAEVANVPRRWRKRYVRAMTTNSRKAAMDAFCDMCMGYEKEPCEHTICPLFKYRPQVRR